MAKRKDKSAKGRPVHIVKKELVESNHCTSCCKKFSGLFVFHIGQCALVIMYSFLGAFTFQAFEAPYEKEKHQEVSKMRENTVKKLWDITYDLNVLHRENWTKLVSEEIKRFQRKLVVAMKGGYNGRDSATSQQWTFSGAFLYSLTVLTTIGYGNFAPRTDWGKLITIFYAIVGIPLMFLYMTNIGILLAKIFKHIYGRVCNSNNKSKQKKRKPPMEQYKIHHIVLRDSAANIHSSIHLNLPAKFNHAYERDGKTFSQSEEQKSEEESSTERKVSIPISICIFIILCYIFAGAAVFSRWENWNYLEASYFCFVTLSTIGLGDLIPGYTDNHDKGTEEKVVACSIYLLGGMALISMCFNLLREDVVRRVKNIWRKLSVIKQERESQK